MCFLTPKKHGKMCKKGVGNAGKMCNTSIIPIIPLFDDMKKGIMDIINNRGDDGGKRENNEANNRT